MEPKILYEDQFLFALDKPSGVMVHTDGRSQEKTLVDWIRANYPELEEVGESQVLQNGERVKRPGIVHRLDRDTSGVILVAKTKEAHQFLKEQFQNRRVEKIYHAVVWGNFSPDKMVGVIDKPIGRSASDFRKWSAEFGAKGELREAVTEYRVLEQNKEISYLEVRPKTGRTHQIRVHLKAISHPVVGDKLYGPKIPNPIFGRLALHAFSIKLELPPARTDRGGNHTFITIESPLPKEFEEAIIFLKKNEKSAKMGE